MAIVNLRFPEGERTRERTRKVGKTEAQSVAVTDGYARRSSAPAPIGSYGNWPTYLCTEKAESRTAE